jgi:L-fucose isomerase-like protein
MTLKISLLTMGMEKDRARDLSRELQNTPDTSLECVTYDLFQNMSAVKAILDIVAARSDIIVFCWDIDKRPSRLKMELVFFLYGFLGMQYQLLSLARRPVIILPAIPTASFLHGDVVAYLKSQGKNAYLARSVADVKREIRLLFNPPVLGGKKVLIFGAPFKSSTIRTPSLSKENVLRRTGVTVDHRSLRELLAGIKRVDSEKVKAEMDRWIGEAHHVQPGLSKEIEGACRLYLYVKESIEKGGYSGVSISCITKSFPENPVMPHPCLAFSRFRDSGVSAVCEGDLCALLTSMLMEHIARKPSYMGNVASVDMEAGTVVITHCVTALKMNGYDSPPIAYSLEDYHHTGKGVVPSVDFSKGTAVTLGLLSKDLNHFVVWPGTLIGSGADFCANMARIKIDDPNGFRHSIAGCHYVMVYGNIVKELHGVLLDLNMTPIGPVGP